MVPRERRPAWTPVVLAAGLACLGALVSPELILRDARALLVYCALSLGGVCSLSALLFSVSGRRSTGSRLAWALVTGTIVGLAWWVRVGLARLFSSAEADFVSSSALARLDAVSPELRASFTGLAVGAVVFWGFVAAIGWAHRRERRRRVALRRLARAAWRPGSV